MAYGTLQGVQDALLGYTELIAQAQITTDMIDRFLTRASNKIDSKLIAIEGLTLPLASPPGVINDIAVDLAVCLILKRQTVGKDPNETEYMKMYCVDPVTLLDDLIKTNPELFDETIGAKLMQSNRVGKDRKFVQKITEGETSEDDGNMEVW